MSAAIVTAEFPGQLTRKLTVTRGPICWTCSRNLGSGEPVHYAVRRDRIYCNWYEVVPVCAACLNSLDEYKWDRRDVAENPWKAVPCAGCARAMWPPLLAGVTRRRWCCEACRGRARYRSRQGSTERMCVRCRAPFSARSDARYCSARCRQATYRARAEVPQ